MNEISITTTDSGEVIVSPLGRLDMVAAPLLREQIRTQVQQGNIDVVVDLSGVDLIDSAGLSALISGLKAARQAGGGLRIARPSKQVRSILKLTNLHRVFETSDAADGAHSEPT